MAFRGQEVCVTDKIATLAKLMKTIKAGEIKIPSGDELIEELCKFPVPKPSPAHIVDREGCNRNHGKGDILSANLAHEIYEGFAWAEWVSVQRVSKRFTVKVKHSYPINIRADLRAWLQAHVFAKNGMTFELQVKHLGVTP